MPRPQVLFGDMPVMIEDLLRDALADVDVDLLPRGAGVSELRIVDEDETPPVVIVVSNSPDADRYERDLFRPRPEVVILRVESNGELLASRAVEVRRQVCPGKLTELSLIDAIQSAPSWRQRFA
jgi:hypothetical protein